MVEAMKKRRWAGRLSIAAAILGLGSVAAAAIAAFGAGGGAWHFGVGFSVLRYAFFAAIAGIVLALVAIFIARSAAPKLILLNLAVILVAGAFVAFLGNQIRTARSVPPIHDISTDLEDWPQFHRLAEREDNLAVVPDMGRAELAALSPRERWKAIHREHYGDIATIRVPWSVEETVARARALAENRGWEIVTADPDNGIVEAVDTSLFFRFKDDVVVRVRPAGDGTGSIVDMRSVSRVGVSDIGVNARRVREFLADLRRGDMPAG
ncbi:DUF1499 domain-containing protein [Sphingosinicella sp. CPCC 101087]|uniref:DUF1499 domain-containing protein n=1 Tax=Sphingosinicella sp. CPCC 101087 TaxID=2497754 RepID=UPI00101DFED9|nr:DUF1499 domain-containing protein [Sphingosinicella sp. CPCC 101087]